MLMFCFLTGITYINAEDIKIKSPSIVRAGDTVEMSIEGFQGSNVVWNDGGASGSFDKKEGVLIKWTAPKQPSKNNPSIFSVQIKDTKGVSSTITKNIAVLGGDIEIQPLIIFCDGKGPMRSMKAAPNQHKDTKYRWDLMLGSQNVILTANDITRNELKINGLRVSDRKDDTIIRLTYNLTYNGESLAFQVIKPFVVNFIKGLKSNLEKKELFDGPDIYGYNYVYSYQLINQFDDPVYAEGLTVNQKIKMISNPLGLREADFDFSKNSFITDNEGKFYYTFRVTRNIPLPERLIVELIQNYLLVNKLDTLVLKTKNGQKYSDADLDEELIKRGCNILKNSIVYRNKSVEIKTIMRQ
jgi:hypothetical protein